MNGPIVFFGSPKFAVPSLNALIEAGEDIKLVVTQADKPRGRGRAISPTPVKELALKHNIPVISPQKIRNEEFLETIRKVSPEFIVVVAYGKILPNALLDIPSIAPLNVHASLLPRYRGASPIAWAIINGEKISGVTTMIITEKLDEGDILLQKSTKILDEDTAETLGKRLSIIGADLIVKTMKGMREGNIKRFPQVGESNYSGLLRKEDGLIDWTKSAKEIFNFIRGMYPWPTAHCTINREKVKLIKSLAIDGDGTPAMVHTVTKDSLIIGTGNGLLSIVELKPEGKGIMQVSAYLQGRKIKEGSLIK